MLRLLYQLHIVGVHAEREYQVEHLNSSVTITRHYAHSDSLQCCCYRIVIDASAFLIKWLL